MNLVFIRVLSNQRIDILITLRNVRHRIGNETGLFIIFIPIFQRIVHLGCRRELQRHLKHNPITERMMACPRLVLLYSIQMAKTDIRFFSIDI